MRIVFRFDNTTKIIVGFTLLVFLYATWRIERQKHNDGWSISGFPYHDAIQLGLNKIAGDYRLSLSPQGGQIWVETPLFYVLIVAGEFSANVLVVILFVGVFTIVIELCYHYVLKSKSEGK